MREVVRNRLRSLSKSYIPPSGICWNKRLLEDEMETFTKELQKAEDFKCSTDSPMVPLSIAHSKRQNIFGSSGLLGHSLLNRRCLSKIMRSATAVSGNFAESRTCGPAQAANHPNIDTVDRGHTIEPS